jgi:hypothetical protein
MSPPMPSPEPALLTGSSAPAALAALDLAALRPVRLFPLTDPNRWVALLNAENEEIALIEDLAALPAEQRQQLEQAIARRDFVPLITAIDRIVRATHGHDWHVQTDRAATVIRVESDESIQRLGTSRMVIIDHRGTRYLIPDTTALDARSQQRLGSYY